MKANYHTHTSRCGHASGRDEQYVLSAAACGFESVGFFTKKFKALMGISPKAYSLQYRKK